MKQIEGRNFGHLIAYVIPGFITLAGVAMVIPAVAVWLKGSHGVGPTVGGFLYVSIASVGLGMFVSLVRWATVDQINANTGLRRPTWNDGVLQEHLDAFDALVENHFRYYQFYANTLVASVPTYFLWRWHGHANWVCDVLYAATIVLLGAGSRNALRQYFRRGSALLGEPTRTDSGVEPGSEEQEQAQEQG